MQTSSIETQEIEAYLSGKQRPEESLLFEAKLLLQPTLSDTVRWQEQTQRLVRLYGRQKLRIEIAEVEALLFTDAAYLSFRNKILRFFKH